MSLSLCVCLSVVNMLSLEHSKHSKADVSGVSKECLKGISRVFQGCSKDVPRCLKSVPRVFLSMFFGCFKGVSRVFQRCFKEVSWMFQGCFKGIQRVF